MPVLNKLLTGAFAVVAFGIWLISLGKIKIKEGRALERAEATESELEAMRDRDDYIEEIESRNRAIGTDELYNGLRAIADEDRD